MKIANFYILVFSISILPYFSYSQALPESYRINFEHFCEQKKYDSALLFARQLNEWALKYESDTSINYAISFRYIGNCFDDLQLYDSAFHFWNKSLRFLSLQNRSESVDASYCLNNIGNYYLNKGDYNNAEIILKQALEIRKKHLELDHPAYAAILNSLGNL